MKKMKGYFSFNFTSTELTTKTRIKTVAKITDESYVENLKIVFYHFDKIVKEVPLSFLEKNDKSCFFSSEEFSLELSGVYWYYFTFKLEGKQVYVVKNSEELLSDFPKLYPNEFCWNLDVYDANLKVYPKWLCKSFYQIMPDRFAIGSNGIIPVKGRLIKDWKDRMPNWEPDSDGIYRNNYFYGGNLKGIKEHVSYFRDLGFDTIYLMPIFRSESNHHYDPESLTEIDPMIGNWEDFDDLATELKNNNMLLVYDCVFNHVSDNSPFFQSACSDTESKYKDWFIKENTHYATWAGFKDMIELNKQNIEVQEYQKNSIELLMYHGVDALRLDLGENLSKDYLSSLGTLKFKFPNLIFINEMWGFATDKNNPQIFDGQADSIMNYPLTDAIIRWLHFGNSEHFKYSFNKVYGEYPKEVCDRLLNISSTHDTPTLMTMLVGKGMNSDPHSGGIWDIEAPWRYPSGFDTYAFREFEAKNDKLSDEELTLGIKKMELDLALLFVIPGNPCVFMGTENAETGYKDPFSRKPMVFDYSNGALHVFITRLNYVRKNNSDILAQGEARIRTCTETFLEIERYNEECSFRAFFNNSDKPVPINGFDDFNVVFSENGSDKNKVGAYGILYLRK